MSTTNIQLYSHRFGNYDLMRACDTTKLDATDFMLQNLEADINIVGDNAGVVMVKKPKANGPDSTSLDIFPFVLRSDNKAMYDFMQEPNDLGFFTMNSPQGLNITVRIYLIQALNAKGNTGVPVTVQIKIVK